VTVLQGACVDLVRLGPIDAGEVLTLQRAAYVSEAQAHSDPDLPPLTESLADLRVVLGEASVIALGLRADGRLVASVRLRVIGTEADLARLVVAPDVQGEGLGSRLLLAAESVVPPGTAAIRLFTGERSLRNITLYERHGYRETHRTSAGTYDLVHLVKRLEGPRGPEHRRLAEIEAAASRRDVRANEVSRANGMSEVSREREVSRESEVAQASPCVAGEGPR
jgi:GNAT superfamily N-acetyltransferase